MSSVSSALSDIKLDTNIASGNIQRLGRKIDNVSRPILLKLTHRSDVINLLKNWRKVKDNVKISSDLTPLQRREYKLLKVKASEWNQVNPNQLKKVIFTKGNPKIVDLMLNPRGNNPVTSKPKN